MRVSVIRLVKKHGKGLENSPSGVDEYLGMATRQSTMGAKSLVLAMK